MVIFCCGCAHGRHAEEKPASSLSENRSAVAASPAASTRVNLPYTFSRRGVEVRVYSIEFSADKLVITVALQETRGAEADLDTSLLIKAQTAAGAVFLFASAARDGQAIPSYVIHLKPNEQAPVTLSYELGYNAGKSVELHFPTGKWWSSVGP